MRWLTDTLARRLFLLMWLTLVGSQLVAFGVVTSQGGAGRGGPHRPALPTLPSLPPTPGLPDASPGGPPPRPSDDVAGAEPPSLLDPEFPELSDEPGAPGLPTALLLLDYGIRAAVIALGAAFGARWLARPMQRLAQASRTLDASVDGEAQLPVLDERRGTREVRETAQVFNSMARRLREQFQARGLLVAAISHDLRTPLTRLRLRLETMQGDEFSRQRCVADLHEMNALIDTVFEVFRGSGADAEARLAIDVGALLQSIADDLAEQGGAVHFAGGTAIAAAEPVALRRVVENLVGNAQRYGGRADLSVSEEAGTVRIRVDDAGPGIPPAHLEAVFQPFHRLEVSRSRDTGGIGLGLYIARDLTLRQGGRLTLANRPEGGLRAEIALPRAAP